MKKPIFIIICVAALIVAALIISNIVGGGNDEIPADIIRPSADSSDTLVVIEDTSEVESDSENEGGATEEQTSYKDAEILRVTKLTTPVYAGEEVTLSVVGLPNTIYDIYVYYSKNPAESDSLQSKCSNGEGKITWTWTVPSGVKAGRKEIAIVGGEEILRVYIDIK